MAAQHHPSPLIAGEGLQFRQQGGGEQDRVARLTLPAGRRCEDPGRAASSSRAAVPLPRRGWSAAANRRKSSGEMGLRAESPARMVKDRPRALSGLSTARAPAAWAASRTGP